MTLHDFAVKCNKEEKTVKGWLDGHLVPGSYIIEGTQEWYIPEDARPPYMKRKPKSGGYAMYRSIANAVYNGCAVFPELYKMTRQRFDVYIDQLINAGIITPYNAAGIDYYEATLKTEEFVKMSRKAAIKYCERFIEAWSKGTAQGVTEGILSMAST